jgi:hypothetical protein
VRATPAQKQEQAQPPSQLALGDDSAIVAKLKELAPQFGYSFSEANSSLVGPGTPADGTKFLVLVGEVKAKLPADPAAATPEAIDQAARSLLKAMQDAAAPSVKVPAGQKRPDPIIPKSLLGMWRTVREEQGETLTVQHDDKYYDQMSLDENNKIGITVVRDGKVFAHSAMGFRYDAKTGKLTLLSDTGSPMGVMMAKSYPDHPELIYVREEGNETVKVYENIGGTAPKPGKSGAQPIPGGPAPKQGGK